MAEKTGAQEIEHYVSCGNVFADLGLPNSEELQLKSELSIEIEQAIKAKRLTKNQAAVLLGISKEELGNLLGHGFSDFTLSQLTSYLHFLGYDVQLSATVREHASKAEKPRQQEAREAVAA